MRLQAIANYLQEMEQGVNGKDLFVLEMPLECQKGILLMDAYAGTRINQDYPGWRETGFRVVVRSSDFAYGRGLAKSVATALHIKRETVMTDDEGSIIVRMCYPVTDPHPYRRSGAGVWEFEVDIECNYIER